MKRFLFPCCLAMAIHALLLYLGAGWIERNSFQRPASGCLALSLGLQQAKTDTTRHVSPMIQRPKMSHLPKKKKAKKRPVKKRPIKKQTPHVKKKRIYTERQKKRTLSRITPPAKTQHIYKSTDLNKPYQEEKPQETDYSQHVTEHVTETGTEEAPLKGSDSAPAGVQGKITRYARPAYLKNPAPVYPRLARERGYEGVVFLEVLVDKTGRVKELRVKKKSGHEILDRAAERSVKNWLFEPAMAGDKAIQTWVVVPIRFKLN